MTSLLLNPTVIMLYISQQFPIMLITLSLKLFYLLTRITFPVLILPLWSFLSLFCWPILFYTTFKHCSDLCLVLGPPSLLIPYVFHKQAHLHPISHLPSIPWAFHLFTSSLDLSSEFQNCISNFPLHLSTWCFPFISNCILHIAFFKLQRAWSFKSANPILLNFKLFKQWLLGWKGKTLNTGDNTSHDLACVPSHHAATPTSFQSFIPI